MTADATMSISKETMLPDTHRATRTSDLEIARSGDVRLYHRHVPTSRAKPRKGFNVCVGDDEVTTIEPMSVTTTATAIRQTLRPT